MEIFHKIIGLQGLVDEEIPLSFLYYGTVNFTEIKGHFCPAH